MFRAEFSGDSHMRHSLLIVSLALLAFTGETRASVEISGAATLNASGEEPSFAGGLVGFLAGFHSSIARSHAAGTVELDRGFAGGLVGDISGTNTVTRSFATGSVTVSKPLHGGFAGGFAGGNAGRIDKVYALGSSSSADPDVGAAGGLVGDNIGTIGQAYSTGSASGAQLVGGAIGEDDASAGSLAVLYWDLDTSGVNDPSKGAGNVANDPGIAGLTDTQLRSGLPSGFDPAIWGESPGTNGGLPYLLANHPPR